MTIERITIPGPVGELESVLNVHGDTDHWAVLCHPHPQYGGTMNDAVLDVVAQVAEERGIDTLRFNFRGTGASAGCHDGGEADDVVAAVQWLRKRYSPRHLSVAGYSFGAGMVWQALAKLGRLRQVLLIAPPTAFIQWESPHPASVPVDVFVGDHDQFADASLLADIGGIRTHVIPGADHFFVGRWEALKAALGDVISS